MSEDKQEQSTIDYKKKRRQFFNEIGENESYESVCGRISEVFDGRDAVSVRLTIPAEFAKNVIFKLCSIVKKGEKVSLNESKQIFKDYFSRFDAKTLNTAYLTLNQPIKLFFIRYFNGIAKNAQKAIDDPSNRLKEMLISTQEDYRKTINSVNAILFSYRKTIEDKNSELIGFDKNISETFIKGYCYEENDNKNATEIVKARENFDKYMENNFKLENRRLKSKLKPSVKTR